MKVNFSTGQLLLALWQSICLFLMSKNQKQTGVVETDSK